MLFDSRQGNDQFSGNFLIDDDVLHAAGIADLSHYAVDPTKPLLPDLYLDA